MKEELLHHIWKFKMFSIDHLQTTNSEQIVISNLGQHNKDSGPDFSNARIKIDGITWVGNVEIHINSSDWFNHNHQKDKAYDNVILHVVWEEDKEVKLSNGKVIPTLELKYRINPDTLLNYNNLIQTKDKVLCENSWNKINNINILSMLDKTLFQRLERKADEILNIFHSSNKNWEETTLRLLAKNYGFKINSEPFYQTISGLPINIILKHSDNLLQLEALLFGQAGFLDEKTENSYLKLLQREYSFLSYKYNLNPNKINKLQWKFLRLRPSNFPTIRIAQFASLIHQENHLFSRFLYTKSLDDLKSLLKTKQSEYWQYHYIFEKKTDKKIPGLGAASIDNLLINTICPLLVAYSKYKDDQLYTDKAISFLENIKAEKNHITNYWKELGLTINSAFDSQAVLELNNSFCEMKKCLECNIGAQLIREK